MANRVTIQIAGQQYTMLADETVEYMNEVAELAQQTVVECGGSTAFASTRALALATVNLADEYIKALEIKAASSDTPIKSLSGGNQQKVILARWLLTHPQYLILDEPTRGIDVGTKTEIQKLVLKLADEGVSVTFISSEIEEMLRTCSRLIVMRDRHIVGELTGDQLSQDNVMRTIAGGGN